MTIIMSIINESLLEGECLMAHGKRSHFNILSFHKLSGLLFVHCKGKTYI